MEIEATNTQAMMQKLSLGARGQMLLKIQSCQDAPRMLDLLSHITSVVFPAQADVLAGLLEHGDLAKQVDERVVKSLEKGNRASLHFTEGANSLLCISFNSHDNLLDAKVYCAKVDLALQLIVHVCQANLLQEHICKKLSTLKPGSVSVSIEEGYITTDMLGSLRRF